MPIRILVIDPHQIMRAGIGLACQQQDDFELIGQCGDVDSARELANRIQADIVIVDPAIDSDQIGAPVSRVADWHQAFPDQKILVFTAHDQPEFASALLDAGASGYMTKEASIDELTLAIRCIEVGRIFISHSRHDRAASPRTSTTPRLGASAHKEVDLSEREREVLTLIGQGKTNKQAAAELFLSIKTVETYRARVMRKHGLSDRHALFQFAARVFSGQNLTTSQA